MQNAFDFAENLYGTVNVVSNNAGVADTKSAYKIDEADWDRVIDTNLKGVWMVAMEAGKRMMAAGVSGSIVNSGSILGIRVALFNSSYCASKAGVIHLTKSLALEWAHKNIRVNALCPGYFPTEMTSGYFDTAAGQEHVKTMPARRIGRMEELRAPFLLLASDAGSYINGDALPVDGPRSLAHVLISDSLIQCFHIGWLRATTFMDGFIDLTENQRARKILEGGGESFGPLTGGYQL